MTRFALIPLAFFANACASAEEVEEAMTDATEEVREVVDEYGAEQDRRSSSYNAQVVRISERMFRSEMEDAQCRYVAAVAGSWRNRSYRSTMELIDTRGHAIVRLQGAMKVIDNMSGELAAKGHNSTDNMTFVLEADWFESEMEGDLSIQGFANETYRFFGKRRTHGLGGLFIGAVAQCQK